MPVGLVGLVATMYYVAGIGGILQSSLLLSNPMLLQNSSPSLTHEWCEKVDDCRYFLPLDLEDILPSDYHVHPLSETNALDMKDIRNLRGNSDTNTNKNSREPSNGG